MEDPTVSGPVVVVTVLLILWLYGLGTVFTAIAYAVNYLGSLL